MTEHICEYGGLPQDEQFEIFYKVYPRKVGKHDARKAWKRTEKVRPSTTELINIIKKLSKSKDWTKDNRRYVPHPATWLNGRRWEDEILPDDMTTEEMQRFIKLFTDLE